MDKVREGHLQHICMGEDSTTKEPRALEKARSGSRWDLDREEPTAAAQGGVYVLDSGRPIVDADVRSRHSLRGHPCC